jgi:hypothetical protein
MTAGSPTAALTAMASPTRSTATVTLTDVRLMASGVAGIGDLRCQITGDAVPTPIIIYDSNPYLLVECLLRGS